MQAVPLRSRSHFIHARSSLAVRHCSQPARHFYEPRTGNQELQTETHSREPSLMPGNRFNAYSNHGIGIGLRIPHYQHIFSRKPVVDWFEIISENFMVEGGRPLELLDKIQIGRAHV